jgi:hypothetical protein
VYCDRFECHFVELIGKEFLPKGDLFSYLRKNNPISKDLTFLFIRGIAAG